MSLHHQISGCLGNDCAIHPKLNMPLYWCTSAVSPIPDQHEGIMFITGDIQNVSCWQYPCFAVILQTHLSHTDIGKLKGKLELFYFICRALQNISGSLKNNTDHVITSGSTYIPATLDKSDKIPKPASTLLPMQGQNIFGFMLQQPWSSNHLRKILQD